MFYKIVYCKVFSDTICNFVLNSKDSPIMIIAYNTSSSSSRWPGCGNGSGNSDGPNIRLVLNEKTSLRSLNVVVTTTTGRSSRLWVWRRWEGRIVVFNDDEDTDAEEERMVASAMVNLIIFNSRTEQSLRLHTHTHMLGIAIYRNRIFSTTNYFHYWLLKYVLFSDCIHI